MSYPSGHLGNSVVWYGVIALLVGGLVTLSPRANLALRVIPPAVVFCTTTYLAFHWTTDSVAGLLLGLVLARIMAAVSWFTMPLPRLRGWERPISPRSSDRLVAPSDPHLGEEHDHVGPQPGLRGAGLVNGRRHD